MPKTPTNKPLAKTKKTKAKPVRVIRPSRSPKAYKSMQIIDLGGCKIKEWQDLTLNQRKLTMLSASKVLPTDEPDKRYQITFDEYMTLCQDRDDPAPTDPAKPDYARDGGNTYDRIYRDAKALSGRGVSYWTKDNRLIIFNWLDRVEIDYERHIISYNIDPRLLPYYTTQRSAFALVKLLDYMPLKSKYALLLYEYLARWQKDKNFTVKIPELRAALQIADNQYPKPSDLLRWVVAPAVKEINRNAKYGFTITLLDFRGPRNKFMGFDFLIEQIKRPPNPLVDQLVQHGWRKPDAEALVDSGIPAEQIAGNIPASLAGAAKAKAAGKTIESLPAYMRTYIVNDYANIMQTALPLDPPDEDRETWTGDGADMIKEAFAAAIGKSPGPAARPASPAAPAPAEPEENLAPRLPSARAALQKRQAEREAAKKSSAPEGAAE